MVRLLGITLQQERLDAVVGRMDRMVALVMVRVTIHQLEHMRAVQQHMDLMAHGVMQKHTTREQELQQERGKDRTHTAIGEAVQFAAVMIG
jgi:hypothetical protein